MIGGAGANGIDSYNLYYGTASGVYDQGPIDGGKLGSWTVTLQPLTTYYIVATARNGSGESARGPEYVYTTTTAPFQKFRLERKKK